MDIVLHHGGGPGGSSAISAVIEAQNILRDVRERANRANQEAAANQQETEALSVQAEKLRKEILSIAEKCCALEENCMRQESIVRDLPDRIKKAEAEIESTLGVLSSLERCMHSCTQTEEIVGRANNERGELLASSMMAVDKERNRFNNWWEGEQRRIKTEVANYEATKDTLNSTLSEQKSFIASIDKTIEDMMVSIAELEQEEASLAAALQNKRAEWSELLGSPLQDSRLDGAIQARVAIEEVLKEKLHSFHSEMANLAREKEETSTDLSQITRSTQDIKRKLEQAEDDLKARQKRNSEALTELVATLKSVRQEIQAQELAQVALSNIIEARAIKWQADHRAEIENEAKKLEEEESHLLQDYESLNSRMNQERASWEEKLNRKRALNSLEVQPQSFVGMQHDQIADATSEKPAITTITKKKAGNKAGKTKKADRKNSETNLANVQENPQKQDEDAEHGKKEEPTLPEMAISAGRGFLSNVWSIGSGLLGSNNASSVTVAPRTPSDETRLNAAVDVEEQPADSLISTEPLAKRSMSRKSSAIRKSKSKLTIPGVKTPDWVKTVSSTPERREPESGKSRLHNNVTTSSSLVTAYRPKRTYSTSAPVDIKHPTSEKSVEKAEGSMNLLVKSEAVQQPKSRRAMTLTDAFADTPPENKTITPIARSSNVLVNAEPNIIQKRTQSSAGLHPSLTKGLSSQQHGRHKESGTGSGRNTLSATMTNSKATKTASSASKPLLKPNKNTKKPMARGKHSASQNGSGFGGDDKSSSQSQFDLFSF